MAVPGKPQVGMLRSPKNTAMKIPDHPFGRENEVSLHRLFRFFCNNLYLGQWELARACLKDLHEQAELLGRSVYELLIDVAENPYGYSLGSENTATLHHLSWLCLQECRILKTDENDNQDRLQPLHGEIELRLLLVEASVHCDVTTINELYLFFKDLQNYKYHVERHDAVPLLPGGCRDLLRQTLESDPALGHALTKHLTVSDVPALSQHNEQLQGIHLECLFSTLSTLQRKSHDGRDPKEEPMRDLVKLFYSLLALFDPKREMKNLQLKIFLQELSVFLRSGQDLISVNGVYSAMLGRETLHLLDVFCDVDHQCRMKQRQSCTEDHNDCMLSDVGHQILSLCQEENREQAWKDLFLTSLKHEKHFLDFIMETSMCLVKTHQFERLSAMLSPLELRPLRPLVLLVGWDHCVDADAAKELLHALGDWEAHKPGGSVIEQACQRLSYQVNLVQWCLDKTSSLSHTSDDGSASQQAALLMHGLETHSLLHMLHRSKQLTGLDHEEVLNILSNRPNIINSNQTASPNKGKAVRFNLDNDQSLPIEVTVTNIDSIDVEMERDLTIYQSYKALRAFMEAMFFCADTVNWDGYVQSHNKLLSAHRHGVRSVLRKQVSQQSMQESNISRSGSIGNRYKTSRSISNWSQVSTASAMSNATASDDDVMEEKKNEAKVALEEFQDLYKKHVVEPLKQGREFLAELYPLKLRVETLENIFSLLFLTNENILDEMTLGQFDSGEEGAVPESRNSSQVGSRDNLSVLESTLEKSYTPSPKPEPKLPSFTFEIKTGKAIGNVPITTSSLVSNIPEKNEKHSSSEVETKETLVGTFSITKTELKETSSDFPKKNSGNQSTNSAGSTGSVYKIGFTANPYVVRDMLAVLKDCLSDLSAAKYRLTNQHPPDPSKAGELERLQAKEMTLNKHVRSSIDGSSLQHRTSRLSQCVSEASWRFQLVAPNQLPAEFGKIRSEKAISDEDSQSDNETAFHSDEDVNVSKHRRRRRRKAKHLAGEGVSAEDSDCKLTTTTTDESLASRTSRSGRKRRRRTHVMMLGRGGVMPLMLSDKISLLNMCLKRGKFSQAQQVVKMFGLERTGSAAEVMFAEHYAVAIKTLQNLKKSTSRSASQGPRFSRSPLHGGKPSLSAIADVAAAGMVTVSATTTVDQILSLNLLPSFSQELLDMLASSASPLAHHIDPEYIQAMIILDLACVATSVYESTSNLVQMMSQRQPRPEEGASKNTRLVKRSLSQEVVSGKESKRGTGAEGAREARKLSTAASQPPLPGIRGYMEHVMQFIHQGRTEANTEMADAYLKKSLNEVLLTATQPHDLQLLVTYGHTMVDLERALRRVQKALQDAHKQETLSLVQAVRAGHQVDGRPATPPGGLREKPVIRQAMKHLMLTVTKSVPAEGISNHLLGYRGDENHQKNEYLHRLYEHVKALSCLVHEAHGDKLLASTIEYFQMLEEGPTQILGKLIFVKKIPPVRLEDVATKLHVNMLQIIINNCCPLVSCRPTLVPPPVLGEEEICGKLVLNPSQGWTGSVQHPGVVVTEILTKLIGLLRDFAEMDSPSSIFSPRLMTTVVQDLRYHQLTAGLAQLKYVDLALLDTREDKLCFYGNLINLMTLHVLLRQVEQQVDREETDSRSRHSSFSTFNRQSSYPGSSGRQPGTASQETVSGLRRSTSKSPGIPTHAPGASTDVPVSGLPEGELEWLLVQIRAAYHVGQLGVVSLFDLKYFILRNGLPAPSSYGGIIKDRCHGFRGKNKPSELDCHDLWRLYGPQPEPRTLFIISEGHVSSPPIQVLSREMVLSQLRGSMKEYLQRTIKVDLETNMVTLPQLLTWHQCDLVTEYRNTGMLYEGLLNLLPTQLDPPLSDNLRTMMDRYAVEHHGVPQAKTIRAIQVVVRPYNMDYTYTFDFDQFSRLHSSTSPTGTGHRRCASLPWTPAPGSVALTPHTPGPPHDDLFHLSPASISYLRSRSELVATLASLVGLIDRQDLQKHLGEEDERPLSPTGSVKEDRRARGKLRDNRERIIPEGIVPHRAGSPEDATILKGSPHTPVERVSRASPLLVPMTSSALSSRSGSPASVRLTLGEHTIAEYRYHQQLQRLPHIWRHILHQVVPLEVARDADLVTLTPEELLRTLCDRELSRDARIALLVSPSDKQLHNATLTLAKILMLQRDWLALVRMLRGLPEMVLRTCGDLCNLHDFACCCVAYTCGEVLDASDTDSNDLWRHLLLVRDATTRSRTVLSMIQFWPVEVAVELLEVCYHGDPPDDDTLLSTIKKRLEETRIYQRITESAKSLQQKAPQSSPLDSGLTSVSDDEQESEQVEDEESLTMGIDQLTSHALEPLCTWQNVVTFSSSSPERVLRVLLEAHEFDVARKWGAIHSIDRDLLKNIEERYISFLLESTTPNQAEGFQVLEHVMSENPEFCLSLCDDLLASLRHRSNTCFVASFMLRHLADHMNKYRQEELRLLVAGCKALLCLPKSARAPYDHLVSNPLLLLEQLLMNSKIEWVSKILGSLHKNAQNAKSNSSPHKSIVPDSFDITSCDALLVKYAARALDFPILQPETQGSAGMVRTDSHASISSQVSAVSVTSQLSHTAPFGGPMGVAVMPSPRKLHPSHSTSTLATQRSTSLKPGSPTLESATPSLVSGRLGAGTRRQSAYSTISSVQAPSSAPTPAPPPAPAPPPGAFVMPPEPPPKDQWVPDCSAKVCMVCGVEQFSMFVRRHHCRRCGRVVCATCSSRTMMIRGISARACDQCYAKCFRSKDVDDQGRLQRLKDRLSGVSSSSSPSGLLSTTMYGSAGTPAAPAVTLLTDYMYVLSADDEDQNELRREEFYYDQAPSTSLCLSILELHSSPKDCGDTILRLCDDVSKYLQPIAPGVRNQEVDYGLVISMLKYLLFNAKMKLQKAGDNAGVARCDVYVGRLVLLRQLVAANCSYIPSMQQLTKIDSLRRLRDRLIKEERLPLAMDVSTKCGIDPLGVWVAWGMTALRAGDYTTARDKFSHCLKSPADKNSTHHSGKLLTDIIEQLETGPAPSTTQAEGLLAPLSSIKDLLAEPQTMSSAEGSGKDEAVSRECLFYLNTYGTHVQLLAFYLRHGNMNKAVHYVVDKRCSREVFVEGLVVPCLSSGKLTRLQDQMQMMDPTLESWALYITAMCRYLDKNKMIHTLYQTQLFIKDFIRAAMTCITYFYQRDATSYSALSGRVHHLLNAKHHLECYLSDRQWGTAHARPGASRNAGSAWGRPSSQQDTSLRLIMTPGEVNKYINTISLQIDVTKFLHRYNENLDMVTGNLQSMTASAGSPPAPGRGASVGRQLSRASSVSPDTPATLFGSTRMKADAANLVLLAGNNVNDGFGLAFRIIQDFKLDATFIYVQAARYFSRLHKYSSVRQLLSCVKDSGLCTDQSFDDVVSVCVKVIADDSSQAKEAEALIKMIRSDGTKINAYVLCGKLRSAYLIAVKGERVEDIKRIGAAAERSGQASVKKICDKWLAGRVRTQELLATVKK